MAKKKELKINNTIKRHSEYIDEKIGISIINDFLQLGKILDNLKDTDNKIYNTLYSLIKENLELKEINKDRGTKIQILTKKLNNFKKLYEVHLDKNKRLEIQIEKLQNKN